MLLQSFLIAPSHQALFQIILKWQRLFQFTKKAHLLWYLIIVQSHYYLYPIRFLKD